jgi:hypothetical protein
MGTVTFIDNFGGPTVIGNGSVTASDPTASLGATFIAAGIHTLEADFADNGSGDDIYENSSDTLDLVVKAGAAVTLISSAPDQVQAGQTFPMTVYALDAYGNLATDYTGTVLFTSSDPNAGLPQPNPYTFTTDDQGQHTFLVTLQTAGNQTVTASDTANPTLSTTANVLVTPGPVQGFGVAGFPALTTSGVAGNFTVTALDAFGNVVPTYTGTVFFSSSDQRAGLPSPYTFTSADGGVHGFMATLETSGIQSLTATDPTTGFTGSQQGILVIPAGLLVARYPSPVPAGSTNSFVVAAVDANGNIDPGYTGTVHFTSSDHLAGLPGDYTFSAADQGRHTFQATLKTAGTQSISAADLVYPSVAGMQSGIVVTPGPVVRFRLFGFPPTIYSGVAFPFTVAASDAYDNVVPTYTGTVAFSSTDPRASLPNRYSFTAADQGMHDFTATLRTLGYQSITVTDPSRNLTGTQRLLVNNPGAGPGAGPPPPDGRGEGFSGDWGLGIGDWRRRRGDGWGEATGELG